MISRCDFCPEYSTKVVQHRRKDMARVNNTAGLEIPLKCRARLGQAVLPTELATQWVVGS